MPGERGRGTERRAQCGMRTFRTTDIERARAWIADTLSYPVVLNPLTDPADFGFAMSALRLGPVTFATATYGTDVLSRSEGLGVAYHINVPRSGQVVQSHRGEVFRATASDGRVPVFEPTGALTGELDATTEVLALGFDRQAVESALEEHLEHSVRPLHFPGGLDPYHGRGLTLVSLARGLATELAAPTGLLTHAPVAAGLADALLTTMLYATPHQYREELADPATRTCPRPVKRAVDAMQADPARPFTVLELARVAGVAPRSLQAGFRQHLETTPMAYLRRLRLERAHRDLVAAGPGVSVTEVAGRWGFTHLGRFAAAYQARYGKLPSQAHRR
ncbi:AraC family transcriptional regulator [Streptomyces ochraceiscleroticus]|uniref:AraC family transcriptional regulator n=1 Tax=Streptomyces ochraceiscleroticus TaxID=47761 RepID=A0ABW1MUS3_9ACTN|nr:AraC family transcriptional regulator [Streptomyces ochraceiscleroticus]